ncbi:MAG: flagellar biosynthesis anti-sigma factor FlgM [Acidobacteriota bacterium]|jgi:flagellar biosynthesis anti-sigma factor FlgM|nr:flagellar biosynthesis anti-sigma factor FlgM [Acidobacteriota bacterium]
MEIVGINNFTVIGKKIQPDAHIGGKDRRAGTNTAGSDKVEFSNHGKTISSLHTLINAVPDVRESLVQEVIFSIETGTYNVNTEQVAEKIMGAHLLNETG